jgi:hypothetical protein
VDLEQLPTLRAALEDQEDGTIVSAFEDPFVSFLDTDIGHAAVAKGPAADVQEQMLAYLDPSQSRTVLSCLLERIIPAPCY